MKKFTRKLMASAMTATMAMSMIGGLSASAVDNPSFTTSTPNIETAEILKDDGFRNCANAIINNSELMGIDGDMYNAVIGESYSIATVHSDMSVESNNDNIFFPVISEDNIVGIISATKINGDYHFSASEGIADELNAKMAESTKFALVTDESGNVYTVETDGTTEVLAVENETTVEDYTLSFDEVDDYNNVISDTIFSSDTKRLTNWYNSATESAYIKELKNYPCLTQVGDTCWAYVILSMARYKLDSTITIGDVYGAYVVTNGKIDTEHGATLTEAYNTIDYIFTYLFKDDNSDYSPEKKTSQISGSQIMNNIRDDLPVFIYGTNIDDPDDYDHAVALMGYERTNGLVTGVYIMNTQNGKISCIDYDSKKTYFNGNDGTLYQWSGTITLNGTLS